MAGNIKGITIEFRGDTTNLQKAVRTIDKDVSKLDKEMRQINNGLKFNPSSVDLWKQKQTVLTQKVKETKEKLSLLKQEQAQMDAKGVDKNSEEYRKLQREIITTESKLKTFEAQLKSIGNVNLKALSEQLKNIGDKMASIGKDLSMKVTAPLVAVGAVSAKSFAEVDKTMQLTNATMGNTTEQADMLNQAMKDAAANSTFGMSDAATATLNFARAGLDAEQAAVTLAPAMNLAAAAGGDLDTVSSGLVATINGFGGDFENAAGYADIFANACNNSALDIDSLSTSMSVAAPIFKAAGYDVQDAALYMGVMANNGIDANVAANALKTGMARLVSPSKDAAGWLEKLGIEVTNADGSMKDSITVQKDLHDAFAGLSESEQIAAASAIFGKNQMSNWLALINTAPGDVQELNSALEENDTVNKQAAAMMSGFGGSLEKLKSSVDVAKVSLGEALAPIILKVANAIQSAIDWFNSLSPTAQTVVAVIGTIVAAIGPVLVILGTLASAVGSLIALAPAIGTAITIATGPIGLIVIAIAALIAAGIALYKNWDTIKAYALQLWDSIKATFEGLKQSIIQVWDSVKTYLSNLWNGIKSTAAAVWETIKTVITTPMRIQQQILTTVWNAIKTFLQNAWNNIKSTATTVWNGIKTAVTTPINVLKSTLTSAWNTIKSATTNAWNAIKTAITSPIEKAKSTLTGIINKIKGFFPLKIGKIINFKIPSISLTTGSKTVLGKTITYPTGFSVSWHKKGGIFTQPTLLPGMDGAIHGVGEAGPEAIMPLSSLSQMLADANARQDALLTQVVNIQLAMLDEMQKTKNFKIDNVWAGRYVRDLIGG